VTDVYDNNGSIFPATVGMVSVCSMLMALYRSTSCFEEGKLVTWTARRHCVNVSLLNYTACLKLYILGRWIYSYGTLSLDMRWKNV